MHYSEITGNGFRSLEENQLVEFEVTQGPKDRRLPASAPSERGRQDLPRIACQGMSRHNKA